MSVAAFAAALQSPTPTDCRHSRAAFHCTFGSIAQRRDISSDAKLLHATLVSMIRRKLSWTQAELADELGWESRQRVWRATCELVAVELLKVKRPGLGRPNEYTLVPTDDITPEDIAARARPDRGYRSGHPDVRIGNATRAGTSHYQRREDKKPDYLATRDHGGTDYLQTRYGRLAST